MVEPLSRAGHSSTKAIGARSSYLFLSGVVLVALTACGGLRWVMWAVPIAAVGGHLLWLGIVCAAQGLTSGPSTLPSSNYAYVGAGTWCITLRRLVECSLTWCLFFCLFVFLLACLLV